MKLSCLKNTAYDKAYYTKAQGFIYNQLKESPLIALHNKKGYKFFCFSNFYSKECPAKKQEFNKDETIHWQISSPFNAFIDVIYERLKKKEKEREPLNIGEMSFSIEEIQKVKPKIKRNSWIDTATPVIIRIPSYNYASYGMTQVQYQNGTFWRPQYSFEAFVKQVEENLYKKYTEFFGEEPERMPLIEAFKFKKSISNKILIENKEQIVIGSIWNLKPALETKTQQKIWSFGIETGLGERNSQGFGFGNVVRR